MKTEHNHQRFAAGHLEKHPYKENCPACQSNMKTTEATPDLLQAIKDMMHDIEIFYSKYREPGNKYLINLKAAIRKAEGK